MLSIASVIEAKPPQLTPKDTRVKIEEILKAHVSYQHLTEEIAGRAILNYIDELDPGKTYFLESDIAQWLSPSPQLLAAALQGYAKEDFSVFEEIHHSMLSAIDRRSGLEEQLENAPLFKNVLPSEFKEMGWAKTVEELSERLMKIKSLQLQTAEKISVEAKGPFFQRLSNGG